MSLGQFDAAERHTRCSGAGRIAHGIGQAPSLLHCLLGSGVFAQGALGTGASQQSRVVPLAILWPGHSAGPLVGPQRGLEITPGQRRGALGLRLLGRGFQRIPGARIGGPG